MYFSVLSPPFHQNDHGFQRHSSFEPQITPLITLEPRNITNKFDSDDSLKRVPDSPFIFPFKSLRECLRRGVFPRDFIYLCLCVTMWAYGRRGRDGATRIYKKKRCQWVLGVRGHWTLMGFSREAVLFLFGVTLTFISPNIMHLFVAISEVFLSI